MLNNNIALRKPTTIESFITPEGPVSLVDVDNGRSVRRFNVSATEFLELVIAKQSSQENGAEVPTNRHVVRIDRNVFLSSLQKPRWIKQSCYLVVTRPSNSSFTDNGACDFVGRLIGVLQGAGPSEGVWGDEYPFDGREAGVNDYTALKTGLSRIFTGEL